MTEVEKLYELAEPNRDCNLYKNYRECPMKHTQCEDCENFVYPPFTAEKQIELLKLIIREDYGFEVTLENHKTIWISSLLNGSGGHDSFEESIAGLIYRRWDNIDEAEQNEIREILK